MKKSQRLLAAQLGFRTLLGALILIFASCGKETRDREYYGDLYQIPGFPQLDANRHRGGYGRSDCLLCHNSAQNLHAGFAVEINRQVHVRGESYCMTCHGTNGTQP